MSEFVKVERDGAVLVVTLARPEKKNALTGAMYEALIAAFARASEDADVAALLIEGSGGVFSAGNDIGDFLAYALAPGALIGETALVAVHEAMRVEKVFRDVDANGRRVHLFRAFACHAGRAPAYPSRPKEKTRAIKL